MIELYKYNTDYKSEWDDLISRSRNGSFLFYRDYMEYHNNRFKDNSFIILKNGKMEAVIPGNINHFTYYSHQGLTYGGIISSINIKTTDILEIFKQLNTELKKIGITDVVYKLIPSIYHKFPCQEDIYALYLYHAEKIECNISSVIYLSNRLKFTELRRRGIQKSIRAGVTVYESDNLYQFWNILTANLTKKYNARPTHCLNEIIYLKRRFPENIRLFVAEIAGTIIAGTLLFIINRLVHIQYIGSDSQGKKLGALDLIFDELIHRQFVSESIFDFGISTEGMGNYLNENLIFQKEGFGGRGIVYEVYRYKIPTNN